MARPAASDLACLTRHLLASVPPSITQPRFPWCRVGRHRHQLVPDMGRCSGGAERGNVGHRRAVRQVPSRAGCRACLRGLGKLDGTHGGGRIGRQAWSASHMWQLVRCMCPPPPPTTVAQWAFERGLTPRGIPRDFGVSAELFRDSKCASGAVRWMSDPQKDGQSFNCWSPVLEDEVRGEGYNQRPMKAVQSARQRVPHDGVWRRLKGGPAASAAAWARASVAARVCCTLQACHCHPRCAAAAGAYRGSTHKQELHVSRAPAWQRTWLPQCIAPPTTSGRMRARTRPMLATGSRDILKHRARCHPTTC